MLRSVIVGDVHGCADELAELLVALEFTPEDRLYFVGDLLARGPDSVGVLDCALRTGAQAVVGNHELRLLEARAARRAGTRGPRLGPSHLYLLHHLSERHWEYLERLPLSLALPEHDVLIVHAGLVPGLPLHQHTPRQLTRIRSIDGTGEPVETWGPVSWAERYEGGPHVVFGHNAQQGLQLCDWATGLDTGCVYGGKLTAVVLAAGQRMPPPEQRARALFSVPARRVHFQHGGQAGKSARERGRPPARSGEAVTGAREVADGQAASSPRR